MVKRLRRNKKEKSWLKSQRLGWPAWAVIAVVAIMGVAFLWRGFAVTPRSSSADLNNDGVVNIQDLALLLINFGKSVATGDLNGDGKVSIQDLALLLINFGKPVSPPPPGGGGDTGASASKPCVSAPAPAHWNHVILLMFENEVASDVIGTSDAPYITSLATKCGWAQGWHDGNYRVDGSNDGSYDSKPSYATLTSGRSPSDTGILDDNYSTTTSADNLFNRLHQMGKDTKSYQSGAAGQCSKSNFSGAYHDAMRYYEDLGGQSSDPTTFCNTHDVSIDTLMSDINNGKLPAFSLLLPTNDQNMHNNGVASGDAYAKTLVDPILDSAQYKSGDTAVFFLWDEETPIPNVLMAPSVKPGSRPSVTGGNPISHFSFTRTAQEMLGISPFLGDSGQAPSLLNFFDGK